jgi:hypothetical protein
MSLVGTVVGPLRGVVGVVRSVPAVIEAILVLPGVARQLEEVRENTSTLPGILAELERVQGDTVHLVTMSSDIASMTRCVAEVEKNTATVQQLAEVALPLQGAAARVGRFADRLPQRRLARDASQNGRPPE